MSENFGALLGEFLDKVILSLDEIATSSEHFIAKCVEEKLADPHPADLKRIEHFEEVCAQPIPEKHTEEPSTPRKQRKSRQTKLNEMVKPVQESLPRSPSPVQIESQVSVNDADVSRFTLTNIEETTQNQEEEYSQHTGSQRRRRKKHHSQPTE